MLPYVREIQGVGKQGATVEDVVFANKVVREMQSTANVQLRIFPLKDMVFVAWGDGSEKTDDEGKSTGGFLVTACERSVLDGAEVQMSLLSWASRKLPRVVRSSTAAETQSAAEALDELDWCRLLWHEMNGGWIEFKHPEKSIRQVTGVLVTDSTCLFDALHAKETACLGYKDKREGIEALRIKELTEANGTLAKWVNGAAQLADGLTKTRAAWKIVRFMRNGQRYRIVFDPSKHSARWRSKNRVGEFDDIDGDHHQNPMKKDPTTPGT
jgi:hypothetical protein